MKNKHLPTSLNDAGLYTLALRWVIGWTYFSAFWRRLILDDKLIPGEAGYIGEKFNHFLPNALGIKPIIEYLVSNPDALQTAMVTFTWVEAIVGLSILLGFFTRLMSVGIFLLALGILLGSGWLGTTCLDEWQIGVLGVASGTVLFFTGSDAYSVDKLMINKGLGFTHKKWFCYLGSGVLNLKYKYQIVGILSTLVLALTLFTNQYFHGGVWGELHNKSVRPKVEISNIRYDPSHLTFQLFRVEGADVYGSFLIRIDILDQEGKVVKSLDQEALSSFPTDQISNHYVAKIRPGKYSMILPLGAKADLTMAMPDIPIRPGYSIRLVDISGIEWQAPIP